MSFRMKGLAKLKAEKGVWVTEVPVPTIKSNELLIKIRKTSICGTDGHIYAWDTWAQHSIKTPFIFGHEFVGVVVARGDDVTSFCIGDRVTGEGHIVCDECRNCRRGAAHICPNTQALGIHRQGCFAEYLALPARNARKVPADIPDHIACIFDPLGNAVHATLSFDIAGEDVFIFGAGPIGLMAVAIAKHVGARHVVIADVNEYRLQLARTLGAARSVNIRQEHIGDVMTELGIEHGFHVGLEMSGAPQGLHLILRSMKHGGRVAVLGIPSEPVATDWNTIIFKGLIIKGIYGREINETWYKMTALLTSGLDIAPIITNCYPAEEFQQAFALLESANCGKVIMDWEG